MKKHNNVVYLPLVYMLTHECDEEQAHYVNGIRYMMWTSFVTIVRKVINKEDMNNNPGTYA